MITLGGDQWLERVQRVHQRTGDAFVSFHVFHTPHYANHSSVLKSDMASVFISISFFSSSSAPLPPPLWFSKRLMQACPKSGVRVNYGPPNKFYGTHALSLKTREVPDKTVAPCSFHIIWSGPHGKHFGHYGLIRAVWFCFYGGPWYVFVKLIFLIKLMPGFAFSLRSCCGQHLSFLHNDVVTLSNSLHTSFQPCLFVSVAFNHFISSLLCNLI